MLKLRSQEHIGKRFSQYAWSIIFDVMVIQNQITQKLNEALSPVHLEVINESSMHSVPPGSESHFKVVAVSAKFQDQSLVFRHRMINELLADEIAGPIHALSLHTMTPDEWSSQSQSIADSPLCLGGSKRKKSGN